MAQDQSSDVDMTVPGINVSKRAHDQQESHMALSKSVAFGQPQHQQHQRPASVQAQLQRCPLPQQALHSNADVQAHKYPRTDQHPQLPVNQQSLLATSGMLTRTPDPTEVNRQPSENIFLQLINQPQSPHAVTNPVGVMEEISRLEQRMVELRRLLHADPSTAHAAHQPAQRPPPPPLAAAAAAVPTHNGYASLSFSIDNLRTLLEPALKLFAQAESNLHAQQKRHIQHVAAAQRTLDSLLAQVAVGRTPTTLNLSSRLRSPFKINTVNPEVSAKYQAKADAIMAEASTKLTHVCIEAHTCVVTTEQAQLDTLHQRLEQELKQQVEAYFTSNHEIMGSFRDALPPFLYEHTALVQLQLKTARSKEEAWHQEKHNKREHQAAAKQAKRQQRNEANAAAATNAAAAASNAPAPADTSALLSTFAKQLAAIEKKLDSGGRSSSSSKQKVRFSQQPTKRPTGRQQEDNRGRSHQPSSNHNRSQNRSRSASRSRRPRTSTQHSKNRDSRPSTASRSRSRSASRQRAPTSHTRSPHNGARGRSTSRQHAPGKGRSHSRSTSRSARPRHNNTGSGPGSSSNSNRRPRSRSTSRSRGSHGPSHPKGRSPASRPFAGGTSGGTNNAASALRR